MRLFCPFSAKFFSLETAKREKFALKSEEIIQKFNIQI